MLSVFAVAFARPAKASGFTHMEPVCGPVDGAPEASRVDKSLQQQHGMAEGVLPIAGESLLAQGQNPGAKVWNVPIGKDKKTAVVDHQLQTIILVAGAPTDPSVPCAALPGRGGKAHKGHPLVLPARDVP